MSVSILVQELRDACLKEVQTVAGLPAHTVYTFDQDATAGAAAECPWTVLKTTRRQVVSLRFSRFESQEVVRLERSPEGEVPCFLA